MVFLVPRQIRMAGMTGSVPYYGGRFTPAQAHAAAQPSRYAPPPPPRQPPPRPGPPGQRRHPVEALDDLLQQGVITQAEYDDLRSRVTS
jgi:hypothetical protein